MKANIVFMVAVMVALPGEGQLRAESMRCVGDLPAIFGWSVYQSGTTNQVTLSGYTTKFLDVTLDSTGPTVTYNKLTYAVNQAASFQWSDVRPVPGTFSFKQIRTSIEFDPFTVSATDIGTAPLDYIPGTTIYRSDSSRMVPGSGGFGTITLTGRYSVSGPGETKSGTFAKAFRYEVISETEFDVLPFPDKVKVRDTKAITSFVTV